MSNVMRWVFTLNNPADTFEKDIFALLESDDRYVFFAGQREIAPETGTVHFQGLLVLNKRVRLSWVKKKVIDAAHWEPMKGTIHQALAYVTKLESREPDYSPITWGEEPENQQGKRNDLLAVKALIDSGATESQIAEEHFIPWVSHYRGFREYKRLKVSPRNWKTEVWVIIGPTGTGKSQMASESAPQSELYYKQAHSDWWDGYDGHPIVVLDDFYGWIRFDEMLRLMDRYPMMVQTKGGQTQFLPKKIFITSNCLPQLWYPKLSVLTARFDAFLRRVTKWIFLGHHASTATKTWETFQEAIYQPIFDSEIQGIVQASQALVT